MSKEELRKSAKKRLIELSVNELLNDEKRNKNFPDKRVEDFASRIGISKKTFYNIGQEEISESTMNKVALLFFREGTWLSPVEKKIVTDYLEAVGFKIGSTSNDPQHGLNWYLERFTNIQQVLELFMLLFAEYGLDSEDNLSIDQQKILKELISLGFVELSLMGSYKFKKAFGDEFEIRNSYVDAMWAIARSHAETYFKDDRMVQNFIFHDEILKTDIEEAKKIYIEFETKMNQLSDRAKGSAKKDRSLIFWGAVFSEMVAKYKNQ
ncbi:MAG: hypothetical protein COV57_03130 [Candidatus Liptonbacteria bacterium CG11_big_fil_rev_8_21_14_0_20_35_14]|uniref:Uncharacterized protein n=1 Tax=Candidatus Liptonbacteria bacterium CG11_big_fil_rev_8_21_14_0_20_35_14 TaxID=1974634 RepID=A0A2H0N713_9BACT|nr:MAG: hypothetical protein COV57_03130 [Candidatus Liptonbacteria bacterium CG11_big_fil_rev_8_21_14_0_20_35_14]PJB52571.1 MAG: hypothetical protein CO099_11955 [Bdellovibrio sp. CG_4_9_14_3_um_filter_39_7]